MSTEIKFEDALEPTDFGFIVCSKTGKLRGLWIPTQMENEEVPQSIINLCVRHFGVDPSEFDDETPQQLH